MSAMDLPGSRRRNQTTTTARATSAVPAVATKAKAPAVAYISWIALALMTTSSVASLRAAPSMAVYGLAAVFLYLLPAIVFLLPTSLVLQRYAGTLA
jgi:hypothetical protein